LAATARNLCHRLPDGPARFLRRRFAGAAAGLRAAANFSNGSCAVARPPPSWTAAKAAACNSFGRLARLPGGLARPLKVAPRLLEPLLGQPRQQLGVLGLFRAASLAFRRERARLSGAVCAGFDGFCGYEWLLSLNLCWTQQ